MIWSFMVFLSSLMLSGCFNTPQMDARIKAKQLRDRGFNRQADELDEKSKELPKFEYGSDKSHFDPKDDPYHFPEVQHERSKK